MRGVAPGASMILDGPLRQHARSRPGHPALVHGDRIVDYRELDALVDGQVDRLSALGVSRGVAVGVALSDRIDHVVAMFALARLGAIHEPLDWRWAPGEQEQVARRFGARIVLVEPGAPALGVPTAVVDDAWSAPAAPGRGTRRGEGDEDGPLVVSLSSGTTGEPKGPLLTHSQLVARFRVFWINLGLSSRDRFLSCTPLYYGGGRAFALMMLYSGGTVVLCPPPERPEGLCRAAGVYEATATFLVPTQLRRLLALDDATLAPIRALRVVVSSGSALHPAERRAGLARLNKNLIQYYSSTEGGGVSYLESCEPDGRDASVGRAVFGVDVQCVDDADRPVPAGDVGRVRYRGPGVAEGFFQQDSASAFRDGWFYPGDLGSLDPDGYLSLRGRSKDVIIRGGVNIYPADVESTLLGHPGVADCAVVGWPSSERDEEIAAFVIAKPGESLDEAELLQLCVSALAAYKQPKRIFLVAELPRNSLGKVVKADLVATLPILP